ncbi:MAG TPA: hypothetical protein VIL45_07010 [Thermoplasmata archaeon]
MARERGIEMPESTVREIRELLADLHEERAGRDPDAHRAIAYCGCATAGTYRVVKEYLRAYCSGREPSF